MKTRFGNNRELAHIWAQQKQGEGRGNNMFFRERSIFSYGEHFEIARFITPEVVFFNPDSYSVSTSRHQRYTRNAVSHKTIFTVPSMTDHRMNAAFLIESVRNGIAALKRARTGFAYKRQNITREIIDAERYEKLFRKSLDAKTRRDLKGLNNYEKKEITREWYDAKIRGAEERERIREVRKARQAKENAERWKQGEDVFPGYGLPIMLRVKGEEIQTSQGARIPLIAARKLWRRFLKNPAVPDLAGLNLGHYTVNSVEVTDNTTKAETEGILVVGCHRIPFSELYRMADVLGWRNGVPYDVQEVIQ